jgi:hypothetical protein
MDSAGVNKPVPLMTILCIDVLSCSVANYKNNGAAAGAAIGAIGATKRQTSQIGWLV